MRYKLLAVIVALAGFASLAAIPVGAAQAAPGAHVARTTTHVKAHATCPSGTSAVGSYCTCPSGTSVAAYCTCPSGTNVAAYCTCPSGTSVAAYCTCPSGTNVAAYCTCPKGTAVGAYCATCPKGSTVSAYCEISPQGPPTVYKERCWNVKKGKHRGVGLQFYLKQGINGAPKLKDFKLTLPAGLSFAKPGSSKAHLRIHGYKVKTKTHTLTVGVKAKSGLSTIFVYLKGQSIYETAKLRHELKTGTVKFLTFKVKVTDLKGLKTDLAFTLKPKS